MPSPQTSEDPRLLFLQDQEVDIVQRASDLSSTKQLSLSEEEEDLSEDLNFQSQPTPITPFVRSRVSKAQAVDIQLHTREAPVTMETPLTRSHVALLVDWQRTRRKISEEDTPDTESSETPCWPQIDDNIGITIPAVSNAKKRVQFAEDLVEMFGEDCWDGNGQKPGLSKQATKVSFRNSQQQHEGA